MLIALQLLQFRLQNKPVLFLIENSTAVSHLKKQGGTTVSVSPQVDYQNTAASSRSGYSNSPASHYRSAKRVSRSRVKKRSNRALGVGAVSTGIPVGSVAVSLGSSSGGSLRERYESPSTSVLLPMSGPGSVGDRRVEKRLARRGSVLLSSGLRAISVSTTLPGEDGPEDSAGSSVVSPSAVGAPSEQSVREALPLLPTVAGLLRQPHWDYRHQDPRALHLQLWFLGVSA